MNRCIAILSMWVLILWVVIMTSACSFQVGVGWHGETALDDREYTQKESRR